MTVTRLFNLIRESFDGNEERDYTQIGVRHAIVLLCIPMVLEMGMEAVFALVDIFFVSKLGKEAIATVGLTEGVMMLVYSLAWGLGMGITALVARRVGEKDPKGASRAAMQGMLLTVLLGILIAIPGLIMPERILSLMGAEPEVVEMGTSYMRIMLGGNIVILLIFAVNAIFRGAGDAAMAMRSLALANGLNIILCPLLIYGVGPIEGLGVTGAALATTIGRGSGVVYQLYHLFSGKGRITVRGIALALDPSVMLNILKISAGGVAQFLIASASWVFMVRIIAAFGSAAIAGYTIAVRIIIFSILPSWGMANAASTLVGQNLGAQQPERAERSAWLCGHYNMIFMTCIAVFFWITAPWLISFFTTEQEIISVGIDALRIICLGYFFYGYGMVLAQAFNGAGDTLTPTWMNVVCFWMLEIPLGWFLARTLGWGPHGVFASIAISESALAVLSVVLFKRGKWKLMQV
ncbi:MAG: MATE family efflux transporter [Flavobacteriales bacterium]|nr:MATE family efflux transporter [Flavobacteriales bacterium]